MKVYESSGTFDSLQKTFNLKVETTDILPDEFYISAYYNICDADRYAIVGILQTKDGNATNFSNYNADSFLQEVDIDFGVLIPDYLESGDLDIFKIPSGEIITVYIHHGIGFDPKTNTYDDKYIKDYKAGTYTYYPAGSPPGSGDVGIMV